MPRLPLCLNDFIRFSQKISTGDSGAPIQIISNDTFERYYAVGVVSFGLGIENGLKKSRKNSKYFLLNQVALQIFQPFMPEFLSTLNGSKAKSGLEIWIYNMKCNT